MCYPIFQGETVIKQGLKLGTISQVPTNFVFSFQFLIEKFPTNGTWHNVVTGTNYMTNNAHECSATGNNAFPGLWKYEI